MRKLLVLLVVCAATAVAVPTAFADGAEVILKADGATCTIPDPSSSGSYYVGSVQGVRTPSGNVRATCSAKLVFGDAVTNTTVIYDDDFIGKITLHPGGTATWKVGSTFLPGLFP